ncbi:MAG: hypothetical protein HZA04_06790 [Nitrospinae bacterium]|nr:hypothetical protein [Nitrospinota bacterium]
MEETPWGFPELPPGSGQAAEKERARFAKEPPKYPPAERPVYSQTPLTPEREERPAPERRPASAISVTSLVIGISAVVLAAVFFYRSTVNIRSAENRANQALSAVGELKQTAGGPGANAAMKIELMRTLRALDAMALEFGREPEVMQKVEQMRNETLDLLYALEEKQEGAAAQEPGATPAIAPAPAPIAPATPQATP